jgi:adenylylsulfate kinase
MYEHPESLREAVRPAVPLSSGAVIWFTGLSGSGKSTIASILWQELRSLAVPTECLDGDAIRLLSPTGFTRAERDAHVKRVGYMASRLEHYGVTVICSLISPYEEARQYVRGLCQRFIEVYVATPVEECERRDPKGLYARVRRGEIRQFTGIDDPYEPPRDPELTLETRGITPEDAARRVLEIVARDTPPSTTEYSMSSPVRA